MPFWYFVHPVFCGVATILAGGYIYSLYWFECGNPWLLGPWQQREYPGLPDTAATFGTLAFLFFLFSSCLFILSGIMGEVSLWLRRLGVYRKLPAGRQSLSEPLETYFNDSTKR